MKTLANQLLPSSVDFSRLHQEYSPLLNLVKLLIGVIPNCDPILEIWQVGFRTYNLLVPNLLNLPISLIDTKSNKALLGLAMYSASQTAQCAYCTAHCCSFALRRGLSPEVFQGNTSPKEKAVIDLGQALSAIPANLPSNLISELRTHFNDTELEQLALSIGMMGFLNKFMDAVGVELEAESINDVSHILSSTGWTPGKHRDEEKLLNVSHNIVTTDSLKTYLRVFLQAPGAIWIERQWTNGISGNSVNAQAYLKNIVGYDFPLLKNIKSSRVVRALTTVLRDNLDQNTSEIGVSAKALCGLIFAATVENDYLIKESITLAKLFNRDLSQTTIETIKNIANLSVPTDKSESKKQLNNITTALKISQKSAAAFIFTRAISNSPADVNETILSEISPLLSPTELVELNVWISIQQLMHRLERYYSAIGNPSR
ncbi:hypothetical protein Riv7116_4519 [Rivularia sp. PCC 7116]|uniref:carboxymuconolactone decarboxylase family protein n=1 Tax=Rivularia sp. PCC 7116 TaxID=373994 RepID=UPI00029EC67A|nr:carboxymuconolactone decarboxylase family protein [Rivularia sp. PCC 7116]AFY56940.1 hypothetical protein Riv7116_4519 [Rivularia sp. PCC 7116]